MSEPPEDVEAGELWRMLQEPEPAEVVDFPRRGADGKSISKIRIKALRMDAHDDARIRARKKLRERPHIKTEDFDGNNIIREVEGDMVARELLWLACTDSKSRTRNDGTEWYPQAFPSPEKIGAVLTGDEIAVLFTQYQQVQAKYGPFERSIQTDDELNDWINRLVEGGSAFPLALLSSRHLEELTLSLAQRNFTIVRLLASQWTSLPDTLKSSLDSLNLGISSSGSLQDASTESGSSDDDDPLNVPDEPLSMEDAARIAEKL